MEILQEINFPEVNLAFCPTKFNIQELEEVCELAIMYNVTGVRVQPLMEIGRATNFGAEILPSKQNYVELIKNIKYLNKKIRKFLGGSHRPYIM